MLPLNVIAKVRMTAGEARALLAASLFAGRTSTTERYTTEADWYTGAWGPRDPQWQPDGARHFLSGSADPEDDVLYSLKVLVDLDQAPAADVYVVLSQ